MCDLVHPPMPSSSRIYNIFSHSPKMSWETIAEAAQAALLRSIPERWRLDVNKYKSMSDVTSVPYTCGLLTDDQLKITELTATEIVRHLETRELKAVQVLEAFAARTAIAHQLVSQTSRPRLERIV